MNLKSCLNKLLFCFILLFNAISTQISGVAYNDFDTNPYVAKDERKALLPFLLPEEHPLKPVLDDLFLSERVTLNEQTLATAGFITKFSQPRSFIKVVSHPKLDGYLLKLYLDTELRIKDQQPGWYWFKNRIIGANKIRKIIEKKNIKYFTVPHKWVYPLPINPSPPEENAYDRKNSILVVEDMRLVSEGENLHAWKHFITQEHLKELYYIITKAGGNSYRADNIVYTKEGLFAFIDTEYPNDQPNYRSIVRYLSSEMAAYWMKLANAQ